MGEAGSIGKVITRKASEHKREIEILASGIPIGWVVVTPWTIGWRAPEEADSRTMPIGDFIAHLGPSPEPEPDSKLGSVRYEEQLPAELAAEWDSMDETDTANAEYEHDLIQSDD